MGFVYLEDIANEAAEQWVSNMAAAMQKPLRKVPAGGDTGHEGTAVSVANVAEDTDMLFISVACDKRRVQHFLNECRELRIPYVFITPMMHKLSVLAKAEQPLHHVLAPVTMLEEEVHKAELLSHLARYTGTQITLLTAHDYGSRARTNTRKIHTFLQAREDDLGLHYHVDEQEARKDSLHLHKELADRQKELLPDMIVQTASRDYGLDDILFGPAERYIILHAQVPVALLNPRGDLYSLCD